MSAMQFTAAEQMTLMLGLVAYRETRRWSMPPVPPGMPQPLDKLDDIEALRERLADEIAKEMAK